MVKKRILVLGTYPIVNAAHGGQKRADAIYQAYNSVFSEVTYSAVFFKGFYKNYSNNDIPLGKDGEKAVASSPFTGDIVCGEAIYDDAEVKKKMTKLLVSLKPEIIHVEQPYPYLGLKKLLKELSISPKIIFGSQNIEGPMKREILKNAGISEESIKSIENKITGLEEELSRHSDLVVACTQEDLVVHQRMGAKNLVLAPNGISISRPSENAENYWKSVFKNMNVSKFALFVGSAHPPNWEGFLSMVGKGLGYIEYDSRIVLAGSICDYFNDAINSESLDIRDATFWQRAYSAGRLSDDRLSALLKLSDVIILPITEGGGSNLKTAEAILSDKKVVSTDHGLRSFEWIKEFPNLWIANDQQSFQKSIAEALLTPKQPRTLEQKVQAKQVEWNNILQGLVEKVKEL